MARGSKITYHPMASGWQNGSAWIDLKYAAAEEGKRLFAFRASLISMNRPLTAETLKKLVQSRVTMVTMG